jgi:hypothetical protein
MRALPLLAALALAACATTRTTVSRTELPAQPGAIACARTQVERLGYTVRESTDSTLRAHREELRDQVDVRLDAATGKLRIEIRSDTDPEADVRVTSDVQMIGQACGVMLPGPPAPPASR